MIRSVALSFTCCVLLAQAAVATRKAASRRRPTVKKNAVKREKWEAARGL